MFSHRKIEDTFGKALETFNISLDEIQTAIDGKSSAEEAVEAFRDMVSEKFSSLTINLNLEDEKQFETYMENFKASMALNKIGAPPVDDSFENEDELSSSTVNLKQEEDYPALLESLTVYVERHKQIQAEQAITNLLLNELSEKTINFYAVLGIKRDEINNCIQDKNPQETIKAYRQLLIKKLKEIITSPQYDSSHLPQLQEAYLHLDNLLLTATVHENQEEITEEETHAIRSNISKTTEQQPITAIDQRIEHDQALEQTKKENELLAQQKEMAEQARIQQEQDAYEAETLKLAQVEKERQAKQEEAEKQQLNNEINKHLKTLSIEVDTIDAKHFHNILCIESVYQEFIWNEYKVACRVAATKSRDKNVDLKKYDQARDYLLSLSMDAVRSFFPPISADLVTVTKSLHAEALAEKKLAVEARERKIAEAEIKYRDISSQEACKILNINVNDLIKLANTNEEWFVIAKQISKKCLDAYTAIEQSLATPLAYSHLTSLICLCKTLEPTKAKQVFLTSFDMGSEHLLKFSPVDCCFNENFVNRKDFFEARREALILLVENNIQLSIEERNNRIDFINEATHNLIEADKLGYAAFKKYIAHVASTNMLQSNSDYLKAAKEQLVQAKIERDAKIRAQQDVPAMERIDALQFLDIYLDFDSTLTSESLKSSANSTIVKKLKDKADGIHRELSRLLPEIHEITKKTEITAEDDNILSELLERRIWVLQDIKKYHSAAKCLISGNTLKQNEYFETGNLDHQIDLFNNRKLFRALGNEDYEVISGNPENLENGQNDLSLASNIARDPSRVQLLSFTEENEDQNRYPNSDDDSEVDSLEGVDFDDIDDRSFMERHPLITALGLGLLATALTVGIVVALVYAFPVVAASAAVFTSLLVAKAAAIGGALTFTGKAAVIAGFAVMGGSAATALTGFFAGLARLALKVAYPGRINLVKFDDLEDASIESLVVSSDSSPERTPVVTPPISPRSSSGGMFEVFGFSNDNATADPQYGALSSLGSSDPASPSASPRSSDTPHPHQATLFGGRSNGVDASQLRAKLDAIATSCQQAGSRPKK